MSEKNQVVVKVFRDQNAYYPDERVKLPEYKTAQAAGCDVRANLAKPCIIPPGDRAVIHTGLRVQIPDGWEIQIRPRSGLAANFGVSIANAPGTIDSDFRDEILVILENRGSAPYKVNPEDRIGQFVLAPVYRIAWDDVESSGDLNKTDRLGGLGSTGNA
jgi:dUTP pyrophosphatase